jgi:hypothetical protein
MQLMVWLVQEHLPSPHWLDERWDLTRCGELPKANYCRYGRTKSLWMIR